MPVAQPSSASSKNKDMSQWFNLFADLDPLANPDTVGSQKTQWEGGCQVLEPVLYPQFAILSIYPTIQFNIIGYIDQNKYLSVQFVNSGENIKLLRKDQCWIFETETAVLKLSRSKLRLRLKF